MENPHAERQAVLLERILKNAVGILISATKGFSPRCSISSDL